MSKVVECATTKVKPKVSCGPGVMMTCQRRFILGHKCAILVSACVRTGDIKEISVPSSQFYCKT